MSDHVKNLTGSAISGAGLLGAITLKAANEWSALICSIVGTIAASLTISGIVYGWLKKRKHRRK